MSRFTTLAIDANGPTLAARRVDDLPRDETGISGGQKTHHGRHFGRLPDPPQRERGARRRPAIRCANGPVAVLPLPLPAQCRKDASTCLSRSAMASVSATDSLGTSPHLVPPSSSVPATWKCTWATA